MDSEFESGVEYIQYIYLSIYIYMTFYMSEFHVNFHTQVAGFAFFQWWNSF